MHFVLILTNNVHPFFSKCRHAQKQAAKCVSEMAYGNRGSRRHSTFISLTFIFLASLRLVFLVLLGGAHLRLPVVEQLGKSVKMVSKIIKNKNPLAKNRRHEQCDRSFCPENCKTSR